MATLTGGDVARIRAATGKPERFFVDLEPFTPEQAHAHAQLRPANAHAVTAGVRQHLRAKDGACVFHDAASGCTLNTATRPLACRLYPFEIDALGHLGVAVAGRCHAEETLGALPELLEAMQISAAKVLALHRQLCRELAADARSAAD